ncbi:MAG: butyrate kinase [Oscillospiraceae bacterium]|jgi:butyrate kinase|nr:butyrate kinase [Oscillospiraceae bacterium]
MEKILVLNPGSTSTKIAVYDGETPLFTAALEHTAEALAPFREIGDQYAFRRDLVRAEMEARGVDRHDLTAVVARGGLLPPVRAGAYEVNDDMVWQLCHKPQNNHASNLAAPIAKSIADEVGVKAYVYDPVTVDELIPLVRLTGLPEMRRKGMGHNLNMRATALRYAKQIGRPYGALTVVVAHLGGGITLTLHREGRIIDMISDDEGPFSPERSGGLPIFQVIDMMAENGGDRRAGMDRVHHNAGLAAHLGTKDAREVEKRIVAGDAHAQLVFEAMALEVAKNIAKLSVVVNGRLDAVLLTGGLAHSKRLTGWITARVGFLAPVEVMAGENEMEALALGALRVLRGEETAHTFQKVL